MTALIVTDFKEEKEQKMDRDAQLAEVRKRMMAKKGGRQRDPLEFRPPSVEAGKELKYKFIVLPPLTQGDACAGGKASRTMDLWYIPVGTHWINNKPYECPRVHDGGDCEFCTLGFDLLKDADDEKVRKDIIKVYMPRTASTINIYFPPYSSNPEEVRGKVMWYAAQKTVFDVMAKTLMRDASKDNEDPQAYGFFYLPEDSYVFQLDISHKGGYNDYTASKFLPNTKGPMIKTKEGSIDQNEIDKLLAQRHDLFTKYSERDGSVLAKLAQAALNGAPDREAVETKSAQKTESKAAPKVETKAAAPAEDDELLPATSAKPVTESTKKAETKPAAKPAAQTKSAPPIADDDPDLQALLNDIQQ